MCKLKINVCVVPLRERVLCIVEMPKRKKSDLPPAITGFFPKAPKPEPPVGEVPGRWILTRPTGRFHQTLGGDLKADCNGCKVTGKATTQHPIAAFRPDDYAAPRQSKVFDDAHVAYLQAKEANDGVGFEDAKTTLFSLATQGCIRCRDNVSKTRHSSTSTTGVCNQAWEEIRAGLACIMCGTTRAIELNHLQEFAENGKKYNAMVKTHGLEAAEMAYPSATRKIRCVSHASEWAYQGGPEAMRLEAAKCEPLCSMCHQLDPQSSGAPCNLKEIDKVQRDDYETRAKYTAAKKEARYTTEKRAFVNFFKHELNKCANPLCWRDGQTNGRCLPGFETCYDFDHVIESEKTYTISELVKNTMPPKTAIPLILAELPKTRMLCRNCHKTRKEWDPLK